jgi:hypothetical protein
MTLHNPHAKNRSSVRIEEDFSYCLMALLHQKAQGLEAYEACLRNAAAHPQALTLLERLRHEETEAMRALKALASQCLNEDRVAAGAASGCIVVEPHRERR